MPVTYPLHPMRRKQKEAAHCDKFDVAMLCSIHDSSISFVSLLPPFRLALFHSRGHISIDLLLYIFCYMIATQTKAVPDIGRGRSNGGIINVVQCTSSQKELSQISPIDANARIPTSMSPFSVIHICT